MYVNNSTALVQSVPHIQRSKPKASKIRCNDGQISSYGKGLWESVRSRLTVENDDRASLYSVRDLYHGVYERVGVPIVFDYHHHQFCPGDMTEEEALRLAASTWPDGITPCCHYAESKVLEEGGTKPTPAHSFHVQGPIKDYGLNLDIMVEAKGKEQALARYNQAQHNI